MQIPLNEIKFDRLGYLSLDANERSGFSARELKSVYVDTAAVLLKLIFHKAHANNFNVFNQIGLIGLYALGEPVSTRKQAEASLPSASLAYPNSGAPGLDPETAIQIQKLQKQKDQAVREENFDMAKQFKETIDRLHSIGQELTHLETQKKQAIESEDFDQAKVLKMRIQELRQGAYAPTQVQA